MLLVHGTAVAVEDGGILLRGPSGSGKSDLGLRLLGAGARLVADDQVELRRAGEAIQTRAPAALAGLLEIRGVGIVRVDALDEAPLVLIVDLIPSAQVERLPEARVETVLGIAIPLIALAPFEASAAVKLRFARRALMTSGLVATADGARAGHKAVTSTTVVTRGADGAIGRRGGPARFPEPEGGG